jgi:hypothetical protein
VSRGLAVAVAFVAGVVVGFLSPLLLQADRSFAPISAYDVLEDGRILELSIGIGHLDSIGYVAAAEDGARVELRVLVLHHRGSSTAELLLVTVRTGLATPLGSRAVVDQDGRTIPRRQR